MNHGPLLTSILILEIYFSDRHPQKNAWLPSLARVHAHVHSRQCCVAGGLWGGARTPRCVASASPAGVNIPTLEDVRLAEFAIGCRDLTV